MVDSVQTKSTLADSVQTKSALYIMYNEDAAAHGVYKLGCTDNLARRKFDSGYTTASRRPWTYRTIFELKPDATRLWQQRPLDALAVETLAKRELDAHRATPATAYFGTELFALEPGEIAACVERILVSLGLIYVRRDFRAFTDEHGHRVYEDGFFVPRRIVTAADVALELVPAQPEPERPRPRAYQEEILTAAVARLTGSDHPRLDRGRILMACGTGKTLTMFWLALRLRARTVALIVPRLDLGTQTLESWQRQFQLEGLPRPHLAVAASKALAPPDWPALTTTDQTQLAEWSTVQERPQLIVATYDSSPILAGLELDLLLLDEAHHTAARANETDDNRRNLQLLDDDVVVARHRVAFTATNKKTMTETTHGPVLARYGFERGIEERFLTNYQIVVLTSNGAADDVNTTTTNQNKDDFEPEVVIRALRDYPIRRMLVFCSNRHEGRLMFHRLGKFYEAQPGDRPFIAYLDSGTALKSRRETLKKFESAPTQAILVNVRLFIEGADLPSLDGVALCCSKTSTSDLTQIVGRALRPSLGKTGAYIVVPAVVDASLRHADLTHAKRQAGFYRVFKLLRVLSKLDTDMHAAALSGRLNQARAVRFLPRDGTVPAVELSEALSTMVTDHLQAKLAPAPRREPKYVPVPPALEKYGLLLRVNQSMYQYKKAFRALPVIEWKVPGLQVASGVPVAIIGNSPLGIVAFGETVGASYEGEFTNDGYWTEFGVRESLQNKDRQRTFVKVRLTRYAAGEERVSLPAPTEAKHVRVPRNELVTRARMAGDATIELDVSAAQDGSELFRADAGATFMARKINCRRAIATWLDKGAFERLKYLVKS